MTNIVMLVCDRMRLLEQALATLAANTPREDYTLTLVDDCSSDFRVRRMLEAHATRPNVSLLRIEKSAHVLARGKNLGAFWSEQTFGRGEWLYFSDSDVAFLPGWLGKLIVAAELTEEFHQYKLWGGQIHPYHQEASYQHENPRLPFSDLSLTTHEVLDGPSWLMRWDTWDQVGPFSRECAPGTCQSEDAEWCERLTQNGGRIGVVHPHVVLHTGLTNTAGADAPGRKEREAQRATGYIYE